MAEYIRHEREYVPWAVTLRSLAYIGTMLSSKSSYKFYEVNRRRNKFLFQTELKDSKFFSKE